MDLGKPSESEQGTSRTSEGDDIKGSKNLTRKSSTRTNMESINQSSKSRPRSTIFSDMRERVFGSQKPSILDEFNRLSGKGKPLLKDLGETVDDVQEGQSNEAVSFGKDKENVDKSGRILQTKEPVRKSGFSVSDAIRETRNELTKIGESQPETEVTSSLNTGTEITTSHPTEQKACVDSLHASSPKQPTGVVEESNVESRAIVLEPVEEIVQETIDGKDGDIPDMSGSTVSLPQSVLGTPLTRVDWAKRKFGGSQNMESNAAPESTRIFRQTLELPIQINKLWQPSLKIHQTSHIK